MSAKGKEWGIHKYIGKRVNPVTGKIQYIYKRVSGSVNKAYKNARRGIEKAVDNYKTRNMSPVQKEWYYRDKKRQQDIDTVKRGVKKIKKFATNIYNGYNKQAEVYEKARERAKDKKRTKGMNLFDKAKYHARKNLAKGLLAGSLAAVDAGQAINNGAKKVKKYAVKTYNKARRGIERAYDKYKTRDMNNFQKSQYYTNKSIKKGMKAVNKWVKGLGGKKKKKVVVRKKKK